MAELIEDSDEEGLLDDYPVERDILKITLLNLRRKKYLFIVFQVVFFLLGFFLVTNTLILYGCTYGTYRLEEHVLQVLLFFLGIGLLRLVFLFRKYRIESSYFYHEIDQKSFYKVMLIDLKIWQVATLVVVLFFLSIIVAVFFVDILHLDEAFWLFLDI
jgi:hypothetical protein